MLPGGLGNGDRPNPRRLLRYLILHRYEHHDWAADQALSKPESRGRRRIHALRWGQLLQPWALLLVTGCSIELAVRAVASPMASSHSVRW